MLVKYKKYSRKDVRDIFAPLEPFSQGAGSWGIWGIVNIANTKDYVFFVTFGQSQAGHEFKEGITHEGVLTWQSQPRQGFKDKRIQDFIHHNEVINNIYLFLRTKKKQDFTYLGKLKYLDHNKDIEKPVHFHWQIIDWELNPLVFKEIGLVLEYPREEEQTKDIKKELVLTEFVRDRAIKSREGVSSSEFKKSNKPDYSEQDRRNAKLGLACEHLVLEYEKKKLKELHLIEYIDKIQHISVDIGDQAGYDIKSFDEHGNEIFIEVKGTKGGALTPFFISAPEVNFSEMNAKKYFIYRVYDYDTDSESGKLFIIQGNVSQVLNLEPLSYKVII